MTPKTKKFLIITLVPIMILCLGLDLWLMYYSLFLKDNFSLTTAYVDDMAYSEEEKFFIEIQSFPNMFEAKINYYTDVAIPEFDETTQTYGDKYTFSSGVQFNGGYQAESVGTKTGFLGMGTFYRENIMQNCTYYNTDQNGTSYVAINELADQDKWIYDIGGELALLTSKGNIKYGSNGLGYGKYLKHNMALALEDISKAVDSLEDGKHVVTFDLSQFFNFTLYNQETGRFEEEVHETTEDWMFVNVYVEKHSTTFVSAEQSIFGAFMGDTNWSLYDLSKVEFWRARNEYTLTLQDFTFTYSNGKYLLKLKTKVTDFLEVFSNMKYMIEIDLDNIYFGNDKLEISGFAEKPFGALGIDTIKLTSQEEREFVVYKNYNIVCPDNITIVMGGDA